MTILVGMVGSDGIVFAADELMVRQAPHAAEYDDRVLIQKIQHSAQHHVAFAGVGDHATRQVEQEFLSALDQSCFDFKNVKRSLEHITRDTIKKIRTKAEQDYLTEEEHRIAFDQHLPRALLIVFYGDQLPERQLWSVCIQDAPAVVQITGCRVNGGLGNLCRFFADYYRPGTSVSSLKHLAAYTVLAASRFDSLMIGGLELAVIDGNGFRLISENEKAALRQGYDDFDAMVRSQLLPRPASQ